MMKATKKSEISPGWFESAVLRAESLRLDV
jgi:hypothetical protein